MENQNKKPISKHTTVTLGIAIALISTIFVGSFWVGGLANKVDSFEKKDSPSRDEYNLLIGSVIEIKGLVQDTNRYLLERKD